MIIICATGTLATVSRELDWLVNPMLRVDPLDKPIAWGEMIKNYQESYPEGDLSYIEAPLYRNFASVGLMINEDQLMRRVFFNPYTGEVLGDLPWYASIQRFLRDLHRFLLIPFGIGLYIVSSFGFVLIASLITGLVVYKKWWTGWFRLRVNRNRRIFFGDLHRLAGVWSIWFLMIIGATGAWYFVERAGNDLNDAFIYPGPKIDVDPQTTEKSPIISVDNAIATAKSKISDLDIKMIMLPRITKETVSPYRIEGQVNTLLVRNRANQVLVHPFKAEAIDVSDSRTSSLSKRLFESVDPLHFGDFGGLLSKLIYFSFGTLTVVMSLSGLWMWQRRNKALEEKGLAYQSMGPIKYISLGIVTGSIIVGSIAIYVVTFQGI